MVSLIHITTFYTFEQQMFLWHKLSTQLCDNYIRPIRLHTVVAGITFDFLFSSLANAYYSHVVLKGFQFTESSPFIFIGGVGGI